MADFPWYLGIPFLCSLMYVTSVMMLKYLVRYRITIWQTMFWMNFFLALCSIPFFFIESEHHITWTICWEPVLAAVFCLLGEFFTLVALERGDVSIGTPVMGLKVLFVVFMATIFDSQAVTATLWIAALLSVVAIVLLQAGTKGKHHHVPFTIVTAGSAAFSFACLDILTKHVRGHWGYFYFPAMYGTLFIFSCVLRYLLHEKVEIPKYARAMLLSGIFIMSLQMLMFVFSILQSGEPARVNIVYNARGLWSILAVWWVGHWFDNSEQHMERAIFYRRLAGAVLMLAAIVLVIVKGAE